MIKPEAVTLTAIGATVDLDATANACAAHVTGPRANDDRNFTWSSADRSVATVDPDGIVAARGPGQTIISATFKLGDQSGQAGIRVEPSDST